MSFSATMQHTSLFYLRCFDVCWPELLIFNRLRAIWPTGYQRGSQGKSHQNGDYLKKASNAKKLPSRGNPKAAGSILAERQLFRNACFLSSRHSGDSFRAGSLKGEFTQYPFFVRF